MARVSDGQRDRLRDAILMALILLYLAHANAARTKLGAAPLTEVDDATRARLAAYADQRAALVQSGAGIQLDRADNAAADARQDPNTVRSAAVASMQRYNRDTLIVGIGLWAMTQATLDTYRSTPDPANPNQSAAAARLWVWRQNTTNPDSCAAAEDASPASLDDLIGIAGDAPAVHPGCLCELFPADAA